MSDLARHSQGLGQRPALLLADLIRGFTDPACPLGAEADAVVEANRTLFVRSTSIPECKGKQPS